LIKKPQALILFFVSLTVIPAAQENDQAKVRALRKELRSSRVSRPPVISDKAVQAQIELAKMGEQPELPRPETFAPKS
jgi:hypothetical protein